MLVSKPQSWGEEGECWCEPVPWPPHSTPCVGSTAVTSPGAVSSPEVWLLFLLSSVGQTGPELLIAAADCLASTSAGAALI